MFCELHAYRWPLQLEGKLEMSISDGGAAVLTVASEKDTLWQGEDAPTQRCKHARVFLF